ncbi:MAG TPA: TolC family protein [Gemmataceae bacterium]|jgi:outer membrane protein TolC|nr:TolC family protein [Gemmataceae bacterium]
MGKVRALTLLATLVAVASACAQVADPPPAPSPINLPTALQLAHVRNLDVQVAAERVAVAAAQLDRARSRWLPTVVLGGDFAQQDGRIQDVVGNVFNTSKRSVMIGAGPTAVFTPSELIYGPLAARQVVAAREADRRAAENDTTLAVAEAYFNVQRARGEVAGAVEAERLAAKLADLAEKLAAGLAQPVEFNRAKTELARRRQALEAARERSETASADLNRLIRLPPNALIEPVEAPDVRIELFDALTSVDELIPIGLRNRPELAAQQALVEATLAKLREEKLRPLVPSVIVRGNATNPAGTLSTGAFGGGVDNRVDHVGTRNSIDVQVLWELQGLGFGSRAALREREADNRIAILELLRTQDRVAADVVQAHSQATRSIARAKLAADGLTEALQTVKTHLEGLNQTRRVGETLVLVFRPQEAVAAVQALDQAYRDHFGAVADANRAQFRLYRALGQPAKCVLEHGRVVPAAQLSKPASADASLSGFATDRDR